MCAAKRRTAAARRRNLLIGLGVIAGLLVITLLSVPRFPGESAGDESAQTITSDADGASERAPGDHNEAGPESGADTGDGTTAGPAAGPGGSPDGGGAPGAASDEPRGESVAMTRPQELRGLLSIVIDDVGNNRSDLDPFLSVPGKLTIAVLPGLEYSRESAERAAEAGKEVIVHLPMAAADGRYPGPGTIHPGDDPTRLVSLIANNLSSVPGAVGVNNHMGSLATADEQTMGIVLGYLKARGLFFLDSRTTSRTVVPELAPSLGVPWLERDVFLDNEPTRAYVNNALNEALEIAEEKGYAILIGHVGTEEIATVLKERYAEIRNRGYRFVNLEELVSAPVAQRE